jgi:hypothetical protein
MTDLTTFDPSIAAEFGETSTIDFLGVALFDATSLLHLLMRFVFNMLVCWVLVQFFYYKKSKRRDYYVTFIMFSTTMFLLIFLMKNVDLHIGLTLGLFAIFGMMRYRTETVPIREMTYLFVITGISVINGLSMTVSYAELVTTNLLFIVFAYIIENQKVLKHTSSKLVLYEKIELIVPEKREELKADLEKRTGLKIDKLEVGHIDFLRDVAFVKIYYVLGPGESNSIDAIGKINQYVG